MLGGLFGKQPVTAGRREPAVPPGRRVYAIGDIHGRLDLLRQLHALILADRAAAAPVDRDVLVYVGDYIDRGPESRQTIDYLAGDPLPDFAVVALLGNHDQTLLAFLDDEGVGPTWSSYGGDATLLSYGVRARPDLLGIERYRDMREQLAAAIPASHLAFLRGLALSCVAGDYAFVHAGVRPGVPLEAQRPDDLLWMREEFLSSDRDHGRVIVHGHTPSAAPVVRANRIGIDTGAFASGALTCLVLEGASRRFLSTAPAARG